MLHIVHKLEEDQNERLELDNTVRYNGLILQIPKNEYRHHYIKAEVKVHEYVDRQLAIFYGLLCIGRYNINGTLKGSEIKNDGMVIKKSKAISIQALRKGFKVLFTPVSEMLHNLNAAKADNSYYKRLDFYLEPQLLVLDEHGPSYRSKNLKKQTGEH